MKNGKQGEGGGRPPVVFTPEQVIELKALSTVLNKTQVADYFGITEKTLRAVESRQPEVSTAYKRGKVKQIAKMGYNLCTLAEEGNVSANIFYLKTQGGWREDAPEPIEIPQLNIIVDPNASNAPAE
jgi:hypothetical protein